MLIKSELLNSFTMKSARLNPHARLSRDYSPQELTEIARQISATHRKVYADQDSPIMPDQVFIEFLIQREGADYTAVVYDPEQGGTPKGPYIGYIMAVPVTPINFHMFFQSVIATAGLQRATQLFQELLQEGRKILYVADLARLRTDTAKREMASMYLDLISQMIDVGGITILAVVRPNTSYQVLQRLSKQGVLSLRYDEPLNVFGQPYRAIIADI